MSRSPTCGRKHLSADDQLSGMPSRRTLLGTCASGTLLGIGGCLSSGGDPSAEETGDAEPAQTTRTKTPPTGSSTATETTAVLPTAEETAPSAVAERGVPRLPSIDSDTDDPFRGVAVGDRPESPGNFYETPVVRVWNLTGDTATVAVAVSTDGTELYRTETEFPAGEPLAVAFYAPRTYEVSVRLGDRSETVTVDPDRFRCNASGTHVQVRPETIESGTISTAAACPTTTGGSS